MTKYLIGLVGLALMLGGRPLQAGEAACCGDVGCNACSAGGGCCSHGGCCEQSACCPHCGCRLCPTCHTYCTTKTTIVHKYGCVCEEICIPSVSRCGEGCRCCENGGQCAGPCNNGDNSGEEGCGCHCRIREVHKLVTFPVAKCTPVKKCSVEWTCPKCGGCYELGNCCSSESTSPAVPQTAPAAPAPRAPRAPAPPAPKTTMLPPMPPKLIAE